MIAECFRRSAMGNWTFLDKDTCTIIGFLVMVPAENHNVIGKSVQFSSVLCQPDIGSITDNLLLLQLHITITPCLVSADFERVLGQVNVKEASNPSKVKVSGPAVEGPVKTFQPTYLIVDCSQAGPGKWLNHSLRLQSTADL